MSNQFTCAYCGQSRPDDVRSVEHVLPAAIGAELTIDLVCHDCNQRVGRDVDAPFLDQFWILEARHRHQIPDRRGRIPGPPVIPATLADGTEVIAILDRGGWRAKLIPREDWKDARTMTFGVDADDEHAVSTKLARLDKKHGTGATKIVSRVEREIANPEITLHYEQSTLAWPRMGAKVALAVAAARLSSTFLVSPAAVWLRLVLSGDVTAHAPSGVGVSRHVAGEYIQDPVFRITNPPPEHQILLGELPDRTLGMTFTLFGEMRYFVRLGPDARGQSGVYLLNPVSRTHDWLDWPAWEARIAERVLAANAP